MIITTVLKNIFGIDTLKLSLYLCLRINLVRTMYLIVFLYSSTNENNFRNNVYEMNILTKHFQYDLIFVIYFT